MGYARPTLWWLVCVTLAACGVDESAPTSRAHGMSMDWTQTALDPIQWSSLAAPRVAHLGDYVVPGMVSPGRIAAAPDGRIAVTDGRAFKVFVLAADGEPLFAVDVRMPISVAVDGRGRIFVGEQVTGAVLVFDSDGQPQGMLGGPGAFVRPAELEWDAARDLLYVADAGANEVSAWNAQGQRVTVFGNTASGAVRSPSGLAVDDATGEVFVVDFGNTRVAVFDPQGQWLRSFGSYGALENQFTRPQGLALDDDGRVYVVDTFQGQVHVDDREGLHIGYVGAWGSAAGQLRVPTDAVVDRYNRLLVTSYLNGTVVVYGIDDYRDPSDLTAAVALEPARVNGLGSGRWVTAAIEVPDADASDLDVSTVMLQGIAAEAGPVSLEDLDADGQVELRVKFDRAALISNLSGPGDYALELSGQLVDGRHCTGAGQLQVFVGPHSVHGAR